MSLIVTALTAAAAAEQKAVQAGKGRPQKASELLRTLLAQDRALQQVKIGSCTGNGSSLNVTIQSGWTPGALLLYRAGGSAIYIGDGAIGSGKAVYVRGNAAVPQSMGVIGSLGIYLQSNGFSLGSTISVSAKSFGYVAFRTMPTQAS